MVRVRVYHPDGVFRGGFLTVEHYPRDKFRTWEAPPHPDYVETLVFVEDDRWWLFQLSRNPDLDRPADDIDALDSASRVIRYTDTDAREWFERQGLALPEDLVERIGGAAGASAGAPPASMDDLVAAAILDGDPKPLTGQEQAVLEILLELPPHTALPGPQICARLHRMGIYLNESGLTGRVIPVLKRRCGVQNAPRRGYFLPPKSEGLSGG